MRSGSRLRARRVSLTDVVMPGIDGLELAETFAERYPATQVVLMSGYPDFQHPRMDAIKRRWKFLPKPFHAHDLIEAIRSALGPRHERPQGLNQSQLLRSWLRSTIPGLVQIRDGSARHQVEVVGQRI